MTSDATLRWELLGASSIAENVVGRAIASSRNGRVAAVAGRDPARTASVAAAFGGRATTYEELLSDPQIDAVYLSLANSHHAEWAIACARAGKALLCEKPMGLTADEAELIAAAFEVAGRPLLEGFMYRFHPQMTRADALLAEGAIGELAEVRAHLSVDLRAERDRGNIRYKPGLGGGVLLDMGCYCADLLRRFLGDGWTNVRAVAVTDPVSGVDVSAAAVVLYPGGRTGLMSCSFGADGQGRLELIGSRGVIELPRALIPGLGARAPEAIVAVVDPEGRRREETLGATDQYTLMVEAFADAVLADGPSPIPPRETLAGPRLLDAVRAAAGLPPPERTDP